MSQSLAVKQRKALSLSSVSRADFNHLPTIWLDVPDENGKVEEREYPDYPGIAKQYCEMIVAGKVPRCLYIIQAAQRYLDMLEEASKPGALYYFSDAWACDFLDFFESLNLPSGGKKGDKFVAAPWQIWVGCATFGFRRNDPDSPNEIGARLTREVYVEVPRGSGKSPFSAVIGLYCWLNEEENGSQIFIGAPKEDQARYVFDPMSSIITKTDGLEEFYGIDVTKSKLSLNDDDSAKVRMISSIAQREDGANPHVVIMEELHAQDEALFNVMDSSLGKRINNLFLSITTAGNRAMGVCWNTRKRLIAVLAKQKVEDSFFGLIYTLDQEEIKEKKIAHQPERWIKCNPMWGITLTKSGLIERYNKAVAQSPAAVLEFERTRLNIWSNGAGGLIAQEDWDACKVDDLDVMEMRGASAWIGADLSTRNDLVSIAILIDHEENQDLITFHAEHFVPTRSTTFKQEEFGPMYDNWVANKHLIATRGFVTDLNHVEKRIRFWCTVFDVQAVVFDNYQSLQVINNLIEDNIPSGHIQPGTKMMSDPFKDFTSKIGGQLVRHDGNPLTAWMVANTVGYYDQRDNVLPKKESPNSPYKIDVVSAACFANAARCERIDGIKRKKPSIYETRGLHGSDDADSSEITHTE